nr:hypothetical protein CFP56_07208 [Quercus suber]
MKRNVDVKPFRFVAMLSKGEEFLAEFQVGEEVRGELKGEFGNGQFILEKGACKIMGKPERKTTLNCSLGGGPFDTGDLIFCPFSSRGFG